MTEVLDHGIVELVDSMGSDLSVVQAARISNGAAMPDWRGAPDEKLISFLVKHEHLSPFEHATFKFYLKLPIFVAREVQRHRTFSYNELSARYKKLAPEFYLPDEFRAQDTVNKQGSIPWPPEGLPSPSDLRLEMESAYDYSWRSYEGLLWSGVAREIARSVLPVGTYTEMYMTGNFRNFMHFFDLRTSTEAQHEIQEYALIMLDKVRDKMPLSTYAFEKRFK